MRKNNKRLSSESSIRGRRQSKVRRALCLKMKILEVLDSYVASVPSARVYRAKSGQLSCFGLRSHIEAMSRSPKKKKKATVQEDRK